MTTSDSGGPASGRGPPEGRSTEAERLTLLEVARAAIRAAAHGESTPPLPAHLPPRLCEPLGAFVSLHDGTGELRGCVGSVTPEDSLAELVARVAAAAATRDPRFPPLTPDELMGLRIEVSILSPVRTVAADAIDPATDGLCFQLGRHRAVLLPQVAIRHGWDRDTLLARLCEKAGVQPTAWQDAAAVLLAFSAETIEGEL